MFENTFFCSSFWDLNLLLKAIRLQRYVLKVNPTLNTNKDLTELSALAKMEGEIIDIIAGIEESWKEKSMGVEVHGDNHD
jgi:hypothetical protein